MKTKEELKALKDEVERMDKKLAELSDDELKQVIGGISESACFKGKFKYVIVGEETKKRIGLSSSDMGDSDEVTEKTFPSPEIKPDDADKKTRPSAAYVPIEVPRP